MKCIQESCFYCIPLTGDSTGLRPVTSLTWIRGCQNNKINTFTILRMYSTVNRWNLVLSHSVSQFWLLTQRCTLSLRKRKCYSSFPSNENRIYNLCFCSHTLCHCVLWIVIYVHLYARTYTYIDNVIYCLTNTVVPTIKAIVISALVTLSLREEHSIRDKGDHSTGIAWQLTDCFIWPLGLLHWW